MHFGVITLFPEMFSSFQADGVVGRAMRDGTISLSVFSLRDYSDNAYRRVDDTPFGGGPGMVLMAEPVALAIEAAKRAMGEDTPVVYLSPRGERLVQSHVSNFLARPAWILICGRYEGVDQRVLDQYVDLEVSIGDFVLSGGELPAMVMMDAIARHVPGVLGNENSALDETFMKETCDHSQYTKPRIWRGVSVPDVLLSGHHENIQAWRRQEGADYPRRVRA